jgi:pimeloyl-ACP methyl ester carboxylesterase
MATYVLVHGAWSGGWGFTDMAERLRAAGHRVFVPNLTGLGERVHLAHPGITLTTHIDDVVGLIDCEELDDIILLGHSYGGMVVTGVAGARAPRIRSLVYLDAFLPRDGQALWDLADEKTRAFYIDAQRDTPGLVQPTFAAQTDKLRRLTGHPLLTLLEPVRLGPEADAIPYRTYIYATVGTPTIFTQFYARAAADPAWRVREIATGHVVMWEDPEGLLALLLEEVER